MEVEPAKEKRHELYTQSYESMVLRGEGRKYRWHLMCVNSFWHRLDERYQRDEVRCLLF